MRATWRIAQHAISLPAFQRLALARLREAVAAGEAPPAQAAYLEDRIHFFEGTPQRYGTQFDWDEHGQISPWTLAEPEQVDALRQSVGLGPLAEKTAQFRQAESAEHRPKDWQARHEGFLAWARSVGWRT